ncbi:MAG: TolC family protein [Desulfobacterota bacterium]|jgi:outer membrane protein TolC|nr:TolC family protein [Thermodesulfobacteriota bacterium]
MGQHIMVVAVIALSLLGTAREVKAAEQRLGLNEAIKIAWEGNPELRALRQALAAQQEEVGVSRSALLPRIGFEERALRTNNPTMVFSSRLNQGQFSASDFALNNLNNPSPITDFQTLFTIEQPLFVGKAFVGLDMAKRELAAKQEDYRRKTEELTLRVVQTYLQVFTTREMLTVARRGVEDSREHLRSAELRFKNGLGLFSDTLRSKTGLLEAEQRVVSAEKNHILAKRTLGLLLGLGEPVNIDQEQFDFQPREAQYYTGASLSRSDLKALELRRENAKKEIRRAESQYLPTLSLGGAYQLNDPNRVLGSDGENWQVMAILRWDLFDGTQREYERKKAHYQASEAGEQVNGLKQMVSFKIQEASLAVEESRKHVELARAALESAEEGQRLVKGRFDNSLAPLTDLLSVQLNLDQARANLVRRENEYRLAVIRLGFEGGTILADLNLNP